MSPIENRTKYPIRILKQWQRVVENSGPNFTDMDIDTFNKKTNLFFNYKSEATDYWKTPKEFEKDQCGDCEDFAIYKFYSLNMPKFLCVGMLPTNEAHAVLVVYHDDKWAVLDNRSDDIIELDKFDFKPAYFCDEEGVYW